MTQSGGFNELREEFRIVKLGLSHNNPSLFVIPQCLNSKLYMIWVTFWLLFYITMIALDIHYNVDLGGAYLKYLTNWAYMLQIVLVILDFGVTVFSHTKRKDIRDGVASDTPWYIQTVWIIFNMNNGVSVLVTLSYYALLEPEFNHGSINKHLLNSVYTIAHLMFSAKPVQILHLYQPMIFAFLYVLFSIIYHALGYDPVYSVLDWSKIGQTTLLSCLLLFIGIPVVHLVVFSLHTLRRYISCKCRCSGDKEVENGPMGREITTRDVNLQEKKRTQKAGTSAINTVRPDNNSDA